MVEEEALRLIREALEQVDYAISRLKSFEEIRSLRWRCTQCGDVKRFTRPMLTEVAPPCPKCRGDSFVADP